MAKINPMTTDLDDTPLTFGKYKGKTPNEIGDIQPSYLMWLYENIEPKVCSKDLYTACELDLQDGSANEYSFDEQF